MKITAKIKEIWNKIFHKNPEMKALPEPTTNQYISSFYREDGSSITISPIVDQVGNQVFEQVLNHRTGELQNIPKYSINSPEISQLTGADICTFLMDFDSSFLQNPSYKDYIINTFLSPKRIAKIIGQYENYAGGISLDEDGNIKEKYIDPGIINGLTATRRENYKMYQQEQAIRNRAYREKLVQESLPDTIHYKNNNAENLSEYNR